jgi:outer membrane protein OmpA-like peptidoglycan-associated protein
MAEANASGQKFLPAIDTTPYFSVYGSQTMQQRQFRVGTFFNYAYRPVEFGIEGERRGQIIDHLLMMDLFGTYGWTDWFQTGLNLPMALYEQFFEPDLAPDAPAENIARMGDLRLELKFRLVNDFRAPVGLSLRPFITFPTGDGDKFVGNDSFTGGIDIIFDVHPWNRFRTALNVGFLFRESVDPADLNVTEDHKFTYKLGMNVITWEWMDIIAELYGETRLSDFFGREAELPLEVLAGFRFRPWEGWQIDTGAGAGLTFGYGSPDVRALVGISYTKPRIVDLAPPPPVPVPVVRVEDTRLAITQKIHFEFDKAVIRPISFHILDAVVDVLRRHPEILLVQVEGHTDAVGTDQYNQRLSDRRAKSVVSYLVQHGISSSRLSSRGFGESKPIDTNDTALGRARNRRTEFSILQRSGPSTTGY